jgi:hypothetical protein
MLNPVGETGQPCRNPLLSFIGSVNVGSSFNFISLFSNIFIPAVTNGLGIFLSCKMLNSSGRLSSSKAFI